MIIKENGVFVDPVNHPHHYALSCSLECIDVMEGMFGKDAVLYFCICNAFKYLWRYKNKNGKEDIMKSEWYVKRAEKIMSELSIEETDSRYNAFDRISNLLNKIQEREVTKNDKS